MRATYAHFSAMAHRNNQAKMAVFWTSCCAVWYKCKEKQEKLLPSYSLMVKAFRSSNVMSVQVYQTTRYHIQFPKFL